MIGKITTALFFFVLAVSAQSYDMCAEIKEYPTELPIASFTPACQAYFTTAPGRAMMTDLDQCKAYECSCVGGSVEPGTKTCNKETTCANKECIKSYETCMLGVVHSKLANVVDCAADYRSINAKTTREKCIARMCGMKCSTDDVVDMCGKSAGGEYSVCPKALASAQATKAPLPLSHMCSTYIQSADGQAYLQAIQQCDESRCACLGGSFNKEQFQCVGLGAPKCADGTCNQRADKCKNDVTRQRLQGVSACQAEYDDAKGVPVEDALNDCLANACKNVEGCSDEEYLSYCPSGALATAASAVLAVFLMAFVIFA
jgi:hypothetical protein